MSVTVKRVDRKSSQRFYELIVETAEVTVRVPFNGYELDDLEKQIDRCFNGGGLTVNVSSSSFF